MLTGFDQQIIYDLVDDVPEGSVATYGMVASLLPGVTARMVGRALGALSVGSKTPWHRIVNAAGRVHSEEARIRLANEGITFRPNGNVDWTHCRWNGPSPVWLEAKNANPMAAMEIVAGWRR